jgi:hypothetical protein
MGLFRRKQTDFDPDLWTDAADRQPSSDEPWFAGDDDGAPELEIATNAGARFDEADQEWLHDDPGAQVRANRPKR